MENRKIEMDDLGGKPPIFGNTHVVVCSSIIGIINLL